MLPALQKLKSATPPQLALIFLRGVRAGKLRHKMEVCLERLDLAAPRSMTERLYRWLVIGALLS